MSALASVTAIWRASRSRARQRAIESDARWAAKMGGCAWGMDHCDGHCPFCRTDAREAFR